MMAPINWFTCLALLMAAISIDMAPATAVVPRSGAQRNLQRIGSGFEVTGPSGEEYVIEFDGWSEVVVMSKSEIVVAETTVVVTGSLITSITIGSNTYSVSYKESGGNPTVTLVDDHATPRRTEEVVKQVDPLVSCEDACEADANQLCGALILGCNPFFPILTPLLGVLCDDVKDLCSDFGIIQGCARTCSPTCSSDTDCTGPNEVCCKAKHVCEVPDITGACGDPHMTGFLGQKFDFAGEDGAWYCLVDDGPSMHLNMRITAPLPSVPQITYITGLSVITTDVEGVDHTVDISVADPHRLDSTCPEGASPCLADGALSVKLDGQDSLISPGEVNLGPGVAISAVNLPGACRSFGFEKYWERKKLQNAGGGRRLDLVGFMQDMSEWILADPTVTNLPECTEYVAAAGDAGLFEHESEHASFQIMTPTGTIRLTHGRLHQLAMRDPTDQFDLPEHLAWQMNVAVDHHDVSLEATGVLGETVVPTVDGNGRFIMQGPDAIRGSEDDYRVAGPLDIVFAEGNHRQ